MTSLMALQYYSLYFYSLLLFFIPRVISYSQFIIIVAVFAVLGMLFFFLKHPGMNQLLIFSLMIGLLTVGAYYLNMKLSGGEEQQHTFFLVLLGQTFPAALGSALISASDVQRKSINRVMWVMIIAFSFLVAMAILFPNTYAGGGGLTTEFALNYQNGSYLSAYTSNFILLMLLTGGKKNRLKKIVLIFLLLLVTFCLLAMGGKGGFVAYVFINGLIALYAMKKKGLKPSVILRNVFIAFVLIIIGYLVVSQVRGFSLGGNVGFARLAALFTSMNDSGRGAIYVDAFRLFLKSPIWGNGLGMIFNGIGSHSHNLFIDCLAETGIIGFALLIVLLVSTARKCRRLIRKDEKNWIVVIVFLQGFVISMFSGYYLAQVLLFGGIVLVHGRFGYCRKQKQLSLA